MRSITIHLPEHIAHRLEVRAAIDDMRIAEGIEDFLTKLIVYFEKETRHEVTREVDTGHADDVFRGIGRDRGMGAPLHDDSRSAEDVESQVV